MKKVLVVLTAAHLVIGCGGAEFDPGTPPDRTPIEPIGTHTGVATNTNVPSSPAASDPVASGPTRLLVMPAGSHLSVDVSSVSSIKTYSLEMWLNFDGVHNQRVVTTKGIVIEVVENHLRARLGNVTLWGGTVRAGEWYHVALIVDGGDSRLYLNGRITGVGDMPDSRSDDGLGTELVIGKTDSAKEGFAGRIDNVRLINAVLTTDAQFTPSFRQLDHTLFATDFNAGEGVGETVIGNGTLQAVLRDGAQIIDGSI